MSSSTLLLRLLLCWLLCTHRPPGRQSERSFKGCRDDGAAGGWIFQIPAFHKAHSIYNDRDIARDTSRHKTNFKTEKSSTATGTARKPLSLATASGPGRCPPLAGWEAAAGILCSPRRTLPEAREEEASASRTSPLRWQGRRALSLDRLPSRSRGSSFFPSVHPALSALGNAAPAARSSVLPQLGTSPSPPEGELSATPIQNPRAQLAAHRAAGAHRPL